MLKLRYPIRENVFFYLLLLSYAYLVISMTYALWFGGGVNIFASYSEPTTTAGIILDANKVYWSKTTFLFSTILLYALNLDYRLVAGLGMTFWAGSLIIMFGPTTTLVVGVLIGTCLIAQQIWGREIFQPQPDDLALGR